MKAADLKISPVNMKDREKVGVRPGDTIRVWIKVEEKGKTRLQPFEGIVLARKHGSEPGATFTVRRVSGGYGVEKIFPLYSPAIDRIEIVKRVKVRRAKLYHIREKAAREIKRQMRNIQLVDISTTSDIEERAKAQGESGEKKTEEAESKEPAAKEKTDSKKDKDKEEEDSKK